MSHPAIACVVMSYRNEGGLIEAVRSVAAAGESVEIVVVNSGGGDPASRLKAAGIDVEAVSVERRLSPGSARNLGIDRTLAPIVSFLAADCIAGEGWIERRLAHHRGSDAVASAIESHAASNHVSRAYHLFRFGTRAPSAPEPTRQLYGVSYRRSLFDRYGLFRQDLIVGEDTEFNSRIAADVEIEWAPDVVTYHRDPDSVLSACRELYYRARSRKSFLLATGENSRVMWGNAAFLLRNAHAGLLQQTGLSMFQRVLMRVLLVLFVISNLAGAMAPRLKAPWLEPD